MLVVNIGGDNSKLNQVITQSSAQIQAFAARVEASMGSVASSALVFQAVQGAAARMLAVMQSIPDGIKGAFDLGGTLSDLSARTGIAAGDLAVLRQAFANAGVSEENVRNGINKLQKSLVDASDGGKEAIESFSRLGLSLSHLREMTPKAQFEAVGGAINALQDPAERATMAMKIFGKSGAEMLTVFSDGKGGLSSAAETLGGQVEILNRQAGSFDQISDLLEGTGKKLQGFFVGMADAIGPKLLPALEKFNAMDFSGLGQSAGAATVSLVSGITTALPMLAGLATSVILTKTGFLQLAATGPTVGASLSGGFRAAAAAALELQARALGLKVSWMNVGGGFTSALGTMRLGIASLVSSVAGAAKSIIAAIGPVNIAIMAAMAGYSALMQKAATINAGTDAVSSISKESGADAKKDVAAIKTLSSEQQRADLLKELSERLEKVRERQRNVNDEFSQLDDDGISRVTEALGMQAQGIEMTIASVNKVSRAFIAANAQAVAATQATTAAIEDQTKAQEKSAEARADALKKLADFRKDMAVASEATPSSERDAVLGQAGAKDAGDLDAKISALEKLVSTGNASTTPQEVARLNELMELRKKLLTLDQQIAKETKAKEEKDAKDQDAEAAKRIKALSEANNQIALLEAELSGDPARVKAVKQDQRQKSLEAGFLDQGMTPEESQKKAKKIVGLEEQKSAQDALQKSTAGQGVVASSLARIGGGGNVASGTASLHKEGNKSLQELVKATGEMLKHVSILGKGGSRETVFA